MCPDCGNEISEGNIVPVECPICGCPFDKFETNEIIAKTPIAAPVGKVDTNTSEKVYYADSRVKITNKIWSFGGYDAIDTEMSGVMYIPVKSISCVDISRNRFWWIWLVLGILICLSGIAFVEVHGIEIGVPIIFVGVILGIIAFLVRARRKLVIKPHNSSAQFSFHLSNSQEAEIYLKPMLLCLKENS